MKKSKTKKMLKIFARFAADTFTSKSHKNCSTTYSHNRHIDWFENNNKIIIAIYEQTSDLDITCTAVQSLFWVN